MSLQRASAGGTNLGRLQCFRRCQPDGWEERVSRAGAVRCLRLRDAVAAGRTGAQARIGNGGLTRAGVARKRIRQDAESSRRDAGAPPPSWLTCLLSRFLAEAKHQIGQPGDEGRRCPRSLWLLHNTCDKIEVFGLGRSILRCVHSVCVGERGE